nr:hypothetical protein CFP56_64154 [Quercus suber]
MVFVELLRPYAAHPTGPDFVLGRARGCPCAEDDFARAFPAGIAGDGDARSYGGGEGIAEERDACGELVGPDEAEAGGFEHGLVEGFNGGEAVCDLVGDDDGKIVLLREAAEHSAGLGQLMVASRERLEAFLRDALAEFRAIVGRDAVHHDQPHVMALDGHGHLVA